MGKITAYKCDYCQKIYEHGLPLTIQSGFSFEVFYRSPGSYDLGACSPDCAKTAFDEWLAGKAEEQIKKAEKIDKDLEEAEELIIANEAERAGGELHVSKVS